MRPPELSLLEQRSLLCQRLQAQRQLIALQLDTAAAARTSYPRSVTMRFLSRRPVMLIRLLLSLATLLRSK